MSKIYNICLIGGSGRSGTTLINDIFSNHPDVATVPEWRFLVDPDGILDFYSSSNSWSPFVADLKVKRLGKLLKGVGGGGKQEKRVASAIKRLERLIKSPVKLTPRYFDIPTKQFCPNFEKHCDELIRRLIKYKYYASWSGMSAFDPNRMYYSARYTPSELNEIFNQFLLGVIGEVCNVQGKTSYMEKNTWNILYFDKILQLLPSAKMLHIYRDPRDVIASYKQQSWMPNDIIACSDIYKDIMHRWFEIKNDIPKTSYYEISLESLVRAPEKAVRALCRFWDLRYYDVLNGMDLTRSHSGRWKAELSEEELEMMNEIIEPIIFELGYV